MERCREAVNVKRVYRSYVKQGLAVRRAGVNGWCANIRSNRAYSLAFGSTLRSGLNVIQIVC
jgi:hypothetical protein